MCSPYPETVRRGLDYFERNLSRQIWLSDVCASLGVSQAYFSRLFRRHVGMPPMRYFQAQRLGSARRLLAAGALSVKEIASRLGFDDPLYFSSQFKKHTGIAPSDYRLSNRAPRSHAWPTGQP